MHSSVRIGRTLLSGSGPVHVARRSTSLQASLEPHRHARLQLLGNRAENLTTDSSKSTKDHPTPSAPAATDALRAETEALKTSTPPLSQQPPPSPGRGPQSVSEFAEEDRKPLPYLSAPLGVTEQPSSKKLSWTERRGQQFDYDKRLTKRKALVKEASRGYFHDVHAMRAHGGKTWLAPTTLIRQDRSLYFPALEGKCLANKYTVNTADMLPGKVSLVCILTSQVSEEHLKSFRTSTYDIYKSDPNFQLVQINLQENYFKAALVSIFMSSLRRQIDESLHKTYLLSHQDLTVEREAIALHNKHVGYIYLVGPDGKIRWAGCGFAERHESQALVACTGVLLSRLNETQAGRTGGTASATKGRAQALS